MGKSGLALLAVFLFAVGLIALLYWLTLDEATQDPCARPQSDISGAVLADEPGDQDALINRAIILKGDCEERAAE